MSADFKYFPLIFGEVIEQVRSEYDKFNGLEPYYSYGTYMELVELCKTKDVNQQTKYPLIWLIWDRAENQGKWTDPYIYECSPRLFILGMSDQDETTDDKIKSVFESILYPIFEIIVSEMAYHSNIEFPSGFTYTTNDHASWSGGQDGQFDILSAIEIKFENLLLYKS